MVSFDETALRRLLGAIDERAGQPLAGMVDLLELLAVLVPCDSVSWSRLDLAGRRALAGRTVPVEAAEAQDADEVLEQVFWLHYQQHPVCHGPGETLPVASIGALLTARAWRSTGLYADYFRPVGVEHQVGVKLAHPPGQTNVLLLNRGPGPDFDDHDQLVLRLLRPHLDAAVRRLTDPAPALTARQHQILALVRHGLTNRAIARRLNVSEHTVRKHLENIFHRLGVQSRTAAIQSVIDQESSVPVSPGP